MNDIDLTRRAFRAYFRSHGPSADQPSSMSGLETAANGRSYVVLRGGRSEAGVCAVYSVRRSGELRLIERWPKDLVAY